MAHFSQIHSRRNVESLRNTIDCRVKVSLLSFLLPPPSPTRSQSIKVRKSYRYYSYAASQSSQSSASCDQFSSKFLLTAAVQDGPGASTNAFYLSYTSITASI